MVNISRHKQTLLGHLLSLPVKDHSNEQLVVYKNHIFIENALNCNDKEFSTFTN